MMSLLPITAHIRPYTTCKLAVLVLALAGCVSTRPDVSTRVATATQITVQQGWIASDIPAGDFVLRSYAPAPVPSKILRVYIEGDGFAWASRSTPSSNPTPINPMGLKLAMADKQVTSVYLARPCQFNMSCDDNKWWTGARFAPEVIRSTNSAIDTLKQRFGAEHIELVGYSGGGVVAALVAVLRRDVDVLITVASPMDTAAWVEHHGISPLKGSLNSAEFAGVLRPVRQMHFVGEDDKIVPPHVVERYATRTQPNAPMQVLAGYSHDCCWAQNWSSLISTLDMSPVYKQYTDD